MRLFTIIIIVISLTIALGIVSIWYFDLLPKIINRRPPLKHLADSEIDSSKDEENHNLKEQCNENELLLQLAQLYIVSPEQIVLLLTNKNLQTTCQDVCDVLLDINSTMSASVALPPENLYLRLYNEFTNYHDCMQDLREDLIECDGPADWFEKTNEAVVCQYYNDIVNCQYTKAAMICGLKPAQMLRSFSIEIMRKVVMFKCKVSRSLPHVDDPMTSAAAAGRSSSIQDISFK